MRRLLLRLPQSSIYNRSTPESFDSAETGAAQKRPTIAAKAVAKTAAVLPPRFMEKPPTLVPNVAMDNFCLTVIERLTSSKLVAVLLVRQQATMYKIGLLISPIFSTVTPVPSVSVRE